MDNVYTCVCGVQLWTIHDGFIRCGCCKQEYRHQTYVENFNEKYKCVTEMRKRLKKLGGKKNENRL